MDQSKRNFLPTLAVDISLWILLGIIITKTAPDNFTSVVLAGKRVAIAFPIIGFLLCLWLALFLFLALLLANSRRGILLANIIVTAAFIRISGSRQWLFLLIPLLPALAIESYYYLRERGFWAKIRFRLPARPRKKRRPTF